MASHCRNNTEEDATEAGPGDTGAEASFSRAVHSGGAMADQEEELSTGDRHPSGGSPLCRISNLINWKRPLLTSSLFAATNFVFWFVTLSPYRVYCLLLLSLALTVAMRLVRDVALSRSKGAHLWHSMTGSWEIIDSGQEGRSGAGTQFTDSWMSFKLFLEETSSFKQQNPGKFCLLVCSLCSFMAILGRYVPGVVISYILVLGIFLWPLVSSPEFGLWMEPVLQKLDFGVGDFLQKIKENHEKRMLQSQAERESIEADLSSLFPKLDSTACKEMSISDTEVSEITWTDNGTFNLSEGHTPQTENSEDLDRPSEEEVFTGGLPEFPSLENGTNGEDDEDLSIGLPTPPPRLSARQPSAGEQLVPPQALELVQRMAGDVIAAAVTAALQQRLEAALGPALVSPVALAPPPTPPALAQALAEDSDSEAEDFELLDQAELEQLEGELGLERAAREAKPKPSKPSGGFFSKLLGRH